MLVKTIAGKRLVWCRVTVVVTGLLFLTGLVAVMAEMPFPVIMLLFALCIVGIFVLMGLDNRPSPARRDRYINE